MIYLLSKISISDLIPIINHVKIIDIRSSQSYNNNHLPGAINIPAEKLIISPNDYLEKNIKYYVYCQRGLSSLNVVSILNKIGYNLVSIDGGYENWIMSQ